MEEDNRPYFAIFDQKNKPIVIARNMTYNKHKPYCSVERWTSEDGSVFDFRQLYYTKAFVVANMFVQDDIDMYYLVSSNGKNNISIWQSPSTEQMFACFQDEKKTEMHQFVPTKTNSDTILKKYEKFSKKKFQKKCMTDAHDTSKPFHIIA